MLDMRGVIKGILKWLIGGFIVMIIAALIFGVPLTPFRLILLFLKTFSGG